MESREAGVAMRGEGPRLGWQRSRAVGIPRRRQHLDRCYDPPPIDHKASRGDGSWIPDAAHGIGDPHQLLHVSFEDTKDVNSIVTTGSCRGNLPAWDF
jgi:hypothetical protein